jgi:hypothetical protein
MSMKSHKNELVGWLTLLVGKQLVLMKLRQPSPAKKSHKVRNGVVAATAAGVVGAVTYLKFKPGGGGDGGANPVID